VSIRHTLGIPTYSWCLVLGEVGPVRRSNLDRRDLLCLRIDLHVLQRILLAVPLIVQPNLISAYVAFPVPLHVPDTDCTARTPSKSRKELGFTFSCVTLL
jgi:hypothetical protein